MDKKALVGTGLSGLIGTRFQTLYQDHYDFHNLDLTTGVDITNASHVDLAVKNSPAEVILHLAAFTDVNVAHEQNGNTEGVCYRVNVVGTKNISQAAAKYGKYFIHVSSDYVFDGTKDTPYTEDDLPHPIEWYGNTKYMAEKEVEQTGGDYAILRPAYPYQANPARPDFLAKMIENLQNNSLPPAFADHTITPTFADDWARVFDYCVQNRPQGLYHATGSSWHTDYEMALIVKEVFNLPGEVKKGSLEEYLKKVNRPYQKTMKISNDKLTRDFGMHLFTFEEGLAEVKKQLE